MVVSKIESPGDRVHMLFSIMEMFISLEDAADLYEETAYEDIKAFEADNRELIMSLIFPHTIVELKKDFDDFIRKNDLRTRVVYLALPIIWIRNTLKALPSILSVPEECELAKHCYDVRHLLELMNKCWSYEWPHAHMQEYLANKTKGVSLVTKVLEIDECAEKKITN